jgi:hypothetical protein
LALQTSPSQDNAVKMPNFTHKHSQRASLDYLYKLQAKVS